MEGVRLSALRTGHLYPRKYFWYSEFEIFSHLYPDLFEDEEKFHCFLRINIEQFYRLSQSVGEEIQKQNTSYRRVIPPEERLAIYLKYVLQICVGDKKGFLDTIGFSLFLN
jgi:hypothetical protein